MIASNSPSANFLAPDGYRYGVMFNDGSVTEIWNGRTQRQRAEEYLAMTLRCHEEWRIEHGFPREPGRSPDHVTLARHRLGEPWERIEPSQPPSPDYLGMAQDYWRIELPFTAPLSLNHRQHWAAKAAKTRKYRALAGQAIMEENVPHERGHIRTWIEYEPRDARRRDPINLIPTLKVCEDALVDQGIVPDDCPEYVESVMPKILPKTGGKSGRLWLVIEEA